MEEEQVDAALREVDAAVVGGSPAAAPAASRAGAAAVDVAVVGGGPAGMAAALAASRAGASVALIDEYGAPGGQIWRRRFDELSEVAPRSLPSAARELCAALAASPVTVLAGVSVWAVGEPGVLLLTGAGPGRVFARTEVPATGAYD